MADRLGKEITVEGLIKKWKRFVGDVEQGYQYSIYDYVNDLGVRRLLAQLSDETPEDVAETIRARIADSDQRFRTATRVSNEPVAGTQPTSDEWWCYRLPWRMGDELRSDLGR